MLVHQMMMTMMINKEHIMENEIFEHFLDDPDEIQKVIKESPPLCMIIRENLNPFQMNMLIEESYLFVVPYQKEERFGVAGGLYKKKQARFDKIDPKLVATCNVAKRWVNSGHRETPVLLEKIDDPLSIILYNKLESERFNILNKLYEIIDVKYKKKKHKAIACAYYDPNHKTEGRIISQQTQIMPT